MLIDVDALAAADGENWVWAGAEVIEPDLTLALIGLSRGGSDATVIREFDMRTREFVAGGFELPEAKTDISWESADSVLVGTDFGPGSLTDSGYPRIVKRWRRGQPLAEATTLFTGEPSDVSVGAGYDPTPGFERLFIARSFDFFNRERYELRGEELIRHRRAHRCRDVGAPRVAVDPAAHRLVAGFHHVSGGFAAGCKLRRVSLRDSRISPSSSSPTSTPAWSRSPGRATG